MAVRPFPLLALLAVLPLVPTVAEEPVFDFPDTTAMADADNFRLSVNATPCSQWFFAPIGALDAPYRVPVATRDTPDTVCNGWDDWTTDQSALLFEDLPPDLELHESFDLTCLVCDALNLAQDSGDMATLEPIIWTYLAEISLLPPLRYALTVSNTTIVDLHQTWFGPGNGFLHAICGEKDPSDPVNIGGYHFWYRFYRAERKEGDGQVNWRCTIEGAGDPGVSTIRFDWDPLGNDTYRRKPIGGFTIGDSPAALLALGHLGRVLDCDIARDANDIVANINGHTYEWVLVTRGDSVHTIYPKAHDRTLVWE